MIKGIWLRRLIGLVVSTLLLASLLTSVIYNVVARQTFFETKTQELRPKVMNIAYSYANYNANAAILRPIDIIELSAELLDAHINVIDLEMQILLRSSARAESRPLDIVDQQLKEWVLQGESVALTGRVQGEKQDYLIIGEPAIKVYANGQQDIVGAVFLFKPINEISAALFGLQNALLWSLVIVVLVMILPTYLASRWFTHPLQQMGRTAMAMAAGDFTIKANAKQKGEMGQLAGTLNYLASALSRTISALLLERNRLRQVLNGLNEGIIAIDETGAITHVNPVVLQWFSSAEDHSDRMGVLPDESVWNDFDQVVAENCAITRSLQHHELLLRIQITPLEDDMGYVVGAVGLLRDVTQSERLEQTRREYVANVSHELRTPLTSLRGLIEPLHEGLVQDPDQRQRYYGIILHETLRLSRLIDDLLELSRLQSGGVALEKRRFDISQALALIAEQNLPKAQLAGIEIVLGQGTGEPCPAWSNPDRIEQVLVILLDNAMKFTPSGGRITLSVEPGSDGWYVCVQDTGPGLAPEDIHQIFERFYKADKSRGKSGTGLGLAIAREVLELLGETIQAQNAQPGTLFRFSVKRMKEIPNQEDIAQGDKIQGEFIEEDIIVEEMPEGEEKQIDRDEPSR